MSFMAQHSGTYPAKTAASTPHVLSFPVLIEPSCRRSVPAPCSHIQALYLETEGDLRWGPAVIQFGLSDGSFRHACGKSPIRGLQWRLAFIHRLSQRHLGGKGRVDCRVLDRGRLHPQRSAKCTWTAYEVRLDRRCPPSRGTLSSFLRRAKQSFAPLPLASHFAFNGTQGSMCGLRSGLRVDASCDRSSLSP
jgi:hypothetical protein